MLRQSPSRNQRSKGLKLKYVLQICVLLAICIWLLYQVKHFRDDMVYKGSTKGISEKVPSGHEIIRLGRKDLHPDIKERVSENEIHGEVKKDRDEEEEEADARAEANEDDTRGAGDDETDGRDPDSQLEEEEEEEEEEDEESFEQGEDFLDEEDKDREEESET